MLKRDFTQSNKKYFSKNKFVLLGLSLFILLGIIIAAVFGFRYNFEMTKHYEVVVNIGTGSATRLSGKVGNIINCYGGSYESYQVTGSGDNTNIIVKYNKALSVEDQQKVNAEIENLSTEDIHISVVKLDGEHTHSVIGASVTNNDYIFTALVVLLVIIASSIFAFIRYNGASAIAIILSNIIANLGFLSINAIFRLPIGLSFFAMIIALNVLVIYCAISLFENIRHTTKLQSNSYEQALDEGMKLLRFRLCVFSIVIFAIGLLAVCILPTSLKLISLNIMFIAVVVLAVILYVVPFIWSVFIPKYNKIKQPKK